MLRVLSLVHKTSLCFYQNVNWRHCWDALNFLFLDLRLRRSRKRKYTHKLQGDLQGLQCIVPGRYPSTVVIFPVALTTNIVPKLIHTHMRSNSTSTTLKMNSLSILLATIPPSFSVRTMRKRPNAKQITTENEQIIRFSLDAFDGDALVTSVMMLLCDVIHDVIIVNGLLHTCRKTRT